jgi:hypothetical protein
MKRADRRWNLRSLLAGHRGNQPLATASIVALAVGVPSLGPPSVRAQEKPPLYKGGVEFWDCHAVPPVQYKSFGNGSAIATADGITVSQPVNWTRTSTIQMGK